MDEFLFVHLAVTLGARATRAEHLDVLVVGSARLFRSVTGFKTGLQTLDANPIQVTLLQRAG